MANVLLLGLDPSIANQIAGEILNEGHHVECRPAGANLSETAYADVLFVSGQHRDALLFVREVRSVRPKQPVIVVARLPETALWIDALEAGATDYCAGPFEPVQIRWIMDSALKPLKRAFAA